MNFRVWLGEVYFLSMHGPATGGAFLFCKSRLFFDAVLESLSLPMKTQRVRMTGNKMLRSNGWLVLVVFSFTISLASGKSQSSGAQLWQGIDRVVQETCNPNYYNWEIGPKDGRTGQDDFLLTLEDSPFPCEQESYIWRSCSDPETEAAGTKGNASVEVIEAERACFCPSKLWELGEACAKCKAVHGYGEKYFEDYVVYNRAVERWYCNTTVPKVNLYWIDKDERGISDESYPNPPKETGRTSTLTDLFPSRTEVSLYYTEGVRLSATNTNTEPFTKASTFGAAATTALGGGLGGGGSGNSGGGEGEGGGGATSTAGAGELRATGGIAAAIAAAIVGAMFML